MLPTVRIALLLLVVKSGLPVMLVFDPLVWMVMLLGSSSQRPATPKGAAASTIPVAVRVFLPEVSTKPPLPLLRPPRARICPANTVH